MKKRKLILLEPYIHIFLWCVVLFYPYIKYMGRENGYTMSFLHELNSLFFKITISYVLYFWFFPLKNKSKYVLVVFGAFVINAIAFNYTDNFFHPSYNEYWVRFTSSSLTYIAFGTAFYVIYALKRAYYSELKINQLEKEKKISELKALKAIINPHFLFNTLNTIYANALNKDEKTPHLILKLSDNFRYLLNDGQKDAVSIKKDVEHLKGYISLQNERLAKKVSINFNESIDNSSQQIPPLLLISFVENAFKYTSLLKGKNHLIDIRIRLLNNQLFFYCENPFIEEYSENIEDNWKESGIGITNSKQRLDNLYSKKHNLNIIKDKGLFKVKLKISL